MSFSESQPPTAGRSGQTLEEEGPRAGSRREKLLSPFVAAFAASERLAQRTLRGPGNFPEVLSRLAPCWASALRLLHLQVGKVTWPRPYIGSERAPGLRSSGLPWRRRTGGHSRWGVHCSVCWPGIFRNCPQTLTQSPRLGVTLRPGFWLCDFITATTNLPPPPSVRRWLRQLGMEDSSGPTEDFRISLDNILSRCVADSWGT